MKIRRVVAAIAVVLALAITVVGCETQPVGASTLNPGQVAQINFYDCQVQVTYGNYGYPFAMMYELPGSHCHPSSMVQVKGYYNGTVVWSVECNLWGRLSTPNDPYGNSCNYDGVTTTAVIQNSGVTAVGMRVELADGPNPYVPYNWGQFDLTPWG